MRPVETTDLYKACFGRITSPVLRRKGAKAQDGKFDSAIV